MTDVLLTPDGDIYRSTRLATGIDLVKQRLQIRLNTFRGEWILDFAQGIPYFEIGETLPFAVGEVRDLFIREISTTEGVASLSSVSATYDNPTQTFRLTANVAIEVPGTDPVTGQLDITLPNRDAARVKIYPGGL